MAIGFVAIAEAGCLGLQARGLLASLRRFGGACHDAPFTVVSPRADRRPSGDLIAAYESLGARYLPLDLVAREPDYGPIFRVLALAEVERQGGDHLLVQLDSDTLFLREPDLACPPSTFLARPVDAKGMCSYGPDDPDDTIWRTLAEVAGVRLDQVPYVVPTLERRPVRASYNAGLIAAPVRHGLFQEAARLLDAFLAADIQPYRDRDFPTQTGSGAINPRGQAFWGTSQVALTFAALRLGLTCQTLSRAYNLPVHSPGTFHPEPVHIHYHDIFSEQEAREAFFASAQFAAFTPDQQAFLNDLARDLQAM